MNDVDFNLKTFRLLLRSLKKRGYKFLTFRNYLEKLKFQSENESEFLCILRHDVDKNPLNSLTTAKIENELGIIGTYYFRIIPESFNSEIIKQIAELGHEIGYHYEDVDLVFKRQRTKSKRRNGEIDEEELVDLAYESFSKNLKTIRENFEINTICMHGSPLSRYDNKMIWGKYNYKNLDLLGEPYFDIDWNEFGYLTDTGRKWNGGDLSVRDKVNSKFKFNFESTKDIVDNINILSGKMMFTIHPQRWTDDFIPWMVEYILQNIKNVVKKYLFVKNK